MNVLFLTLIKFDSINSHNIYCDLLRKFRDKGHNVTVICPNERRNGKPTYKVEEDNSEILHVRTLNLFRSNIVEKGIATIAIEYQYLNAIKKYYGTKKFDLVIYSTPPITFSKVVNFVKKRDGAYAYLLLKDIFPQNAVDLKMMKSSGILHWFFRNKEKQLYKVSDTVGCMSEANRKYLLKHNQIDSDKVEVSPNTVEPVEYKMTIEESKAIREHYKIPVNKTVLIYGGNIGKPQGVEFLLQIIDACELRKPELHFVIIGNGNEFPKVLAWYENRKRSNVSLFQFMPKDDFNKVVGASDIGMIFLNPQFTIPNFPSRLLSYIELKIPVYSATDPNTDVGPISEENGFGLWSISGDLEDAIAKISKLADDPVLRYKMGELGFQYLLKHYNTDESYKIIMKHLPSQSAQAN